MLAFLIGVAPTFAIKSSCYHQAVAPTNTCKSRSNKVQTRLQSFGGEKLTQHLTSLAQGKIVVGIAGAPNCGKSALVNRLKHKRACESNDRLSYVNGEICLLESPALEVSGSQTQRALRNFVRVEVIENLAPVMPAIYELCCVPLIYDSSMIGTMENSLIVRSIERTPLLLKCLRMRKPL